MLYHFLLVQINPLALSWIEISLIWTSIFDHLIYLIYLLLRLSLFYRHCYAGKLDNLNEENNHVNAKLGSDLLICHVVLESVKLLHHYPQTRAKVDP